MRMPFRCNLDLGAFFFYQKITEIILKSYTENNVFYSMQFWVGFHWARLWLHSARHDQNWHGLFRPLVSRIRLAVHRSYLPSVHVVCSVRDVIACIQRRRNYKNLLQVWVQAWHYCRSTNFGRWETLADLEMKLLAVNKLWPIGVQSCILCPMTNFSLRFTLAGWHQVAKSAKSNRQRKLVDLQYTLTTVKHVIFGVLNFNFGDFGRETRHLNLNYT